MNHSNSSSNYSTKNIFKKPKNQKESNIFIYVKNNNLEKLLLTIKKNTSKINLLSKEGLSLLHIAIKKGNLDIINALLLNGANPNILTSKKKQTPLHYAYIYKTEKSEEIIKKLKIWKANENLLDIYNKKPLDYLNISKNPIYKYKSYNKLNIQKENNNENTLKEEYYKLLLLNKAKNKNGKNDKKETKTNNGSKNIKLNNSNNSILNDSLEQSSNNNNNINNNIKDNKEGKINKNNGRNKPKKMIKILTEKTRFNYPKLFNNIINLNLRPKQENNFFNTFNNKKTEDKILEQIITNKRLSLLSNSRKNNNSPFNSAFSTEDYTKNKNTDKKITMIKNKDVVEFNYEDSSTEGNNGNKNGSNNNINNNFTNNIKSISTITNNNNNINTSFNVLNKETITENMNLLFNKKKNLDNNELKDPKNIKLNLELKSWLENLNLSQYLDNFIENDINDINSLINQMKNNENKLSYDDIEFLLKIHKPGHIYKILCSLEILAGSINPKISNFLIKKISKKNNKLKLSVSREIKPCINCFRVNLFFSQKKNDLNNFLTRYNLLQFYQNFYHNGFDDMNYIMVQMFSSEPFDEVILENCLHIYESEMREKVIKCLLEEKNKIINFLESKEYSEFNYRNNIKYEDILFENNINNENLNNNNNNNGKIIIPKNNDCNIF